MKARELPPCALLVWPPWWRIQKQKARLRQQPEERGSRPGDSWVDQNVDRFDWRPIKFGGETGGAQRKNVERSGETAGRTMTRKRYSVPRWVESWLALQGFPPTSNALSIALPRSANMRDGHLRSSETTRVFSRVLRHAVTQCRWWQLANSAGFVDFPCCTLARFEGTFHRAGQHRGMLSGEMDTAFRPCDSRKPIGHLPGLEL